MLNAAIYIGSCDHRYCYVIVHIFIRFTNEIRFQRNFNSSSLKMEELEPLMKLEQKLSSETTNNVCLKYSQTSNDLAILIEISA